MADFITPNLAYTEPENGGSVNTWGTKLNADMDAIDAIFAAAGNGTSVGLNVGTGKTVTINLSGLSLSGADASNYTIANATTTADITPRLVTVTGSTVASRQYNGTNVATINVGTLGGVSGNANSGLLAGQSLVLSGTGTFSSINVGTQNVTATYSLANGTGGLASNYAFASGSGTQTLSGTITPAWLAVIVGGLTGSTSKVYDGTNTATLNASNFTLTGWVNGDGTDVTVTQTTGAYADKNVGGGKLVTVNLSSSDFAATTTNLSNYGLPTTVSGNIGAITTKSLTASYTGSNKVYDAGTTATVTGSSSDIVSGDTVTFSQTAAFADKNAGTAKTINVTGISLGGTDAGNYSLQNTTATTSANITPKALTAGYSASHKVYDALTGATVVGSSADVISGDVVSFSQSAAFTNKNVGTGKTVNVTGISLGGVDAGNYSLQNTTASTSADISRAQLVVAGATATNKVYDGTATATVSGGSVTVLGSDSLTLSAANATFANRNAGTAKAVTTSYVLSGADAANYNLTQPSALSADITPKALSITGVSASNKVYDGTTAAVLTGTAGLSGVVGSDAVSVSGSATGSFADTNAGTGKSYTLTGLALSGADAANYSLSGSTLTAADGTKTRMERQFDMIHVVPPQVAPDFVAKSPLANSAGWVDVDQHTMQHVKFSNVFSLGDAGSMPNAKTTAAIRKQAPIVANNIVRIRQGFEPLADYDGYGACPLTVEKGKVVLAEFSYGGKLAPTFPLNPAVPRRLNWMLKKHVFPALYWFGALKGHEWLTRCAKQEGQARV